jgi:thymidylate synthase
MPFLKRLRDNVINKNFVIDKSGVKTVEILGARIVLNPNQKYMEFNGRKSPKKYIEAELDWYDSQDLHVGKIAKIAKIWDQVSDKDGFINSNYGHLIYSEENGNQYLEVMNKLITNPDSRQALMVYNRPSIHKDAVDRGRSDFICTLGHQFVIRNNQLQSIVNMRSNDAIFGFFNDFAWFATVHQRLLADLQKSKYPDLEMGKLIHIANSFHVYERHFDMLEKMTHECVVEEVQKLIKTENDNGNA